MIDYPPAKEILDHSEYNWRYGKDAHKTTLSHAINACDCMECRDTNLLLDLRREIKEIADGRTQYLAVRFECYNATFAKWFWDRFTPDERYYVHFLWQFGGPRGGRCDCRACIPGREIDVTQERQVM